MNGNYVVQDKDHPTNMLFTKLHQSHNYPHPPPPLLHRHPLETHPFPLALQSQTTQEPNNCTTTTTTTKNKKQPPTTTPNDRATIEVVHRPRGRPPGSKNKIKPPVIITRDSHPSMSPYILELPSGVDIVDSITTYCRKNNLGLCILTGYGTVTNVTLHQPLTTPCATVTFHGRYDILSLSAMISIISSVNPTNGFTISLAGPQGQVVGGSVVGPLLTSGTVYVIAATFNNPSYHRLPLEEDVNEGGKHSTVAVSGGGDSREMSAAAEQGCGVGGGVYSCGQLPSSDVIWAPTARQPY